MVQANPTLTLLANSYVTHSSASVYFSGRLNSTDWLALGPADQLRALITASLRISFEVLNEFKLGTITNVSQPLSYATFEMAIHLASDFENVNSFDSGSNIKKVTADSVEVEFFKPVKGGTLPAMVTKYLNEAGAIGGYGASSSPGGMLVSGSSSESSFDSCDTLSRSRGH